MGRGDAGAGCREARFAWIWTAVYFAVVLLGMWRHEMWRDEYQAWLFARDSASVRDLFANLRYEGHPPLWHLMLYGVTRFTVNPAAMQVVHLVLATIAAWLVLRHAPFSRLFRAAFCFGYFAVYEYAVISRNYSLGLLVALLFIIRYRDGGRLGVGMGLILAGLALSNPFAALMSLALCIFVAVDRLLMPEAPAGRWNRGVVSTLGLGLAGVGLALWMIVPPADGGFMNFAARPRGFQMAPLRLAFSYVLTSHIPIPQAGIVGWNTNWFSDWGENALAIGGVLIVMVSVLVLLRNLRALAIYLIATGGYLAYFYLTAMSSHYLRYAGHLFLVLVISLWFSRTLKPGWTFRWTKGRGGALGALERAFIGMLLAAQVFGGAVAYARDWRHPFTNSAAAAAFIAQSGLDHIPLVGTRDYVIQPLSAMFNRPIFYPERGGFGSFVVWDLIRLNPVTPQMIVDPCFGLRRESEEQVLVVLSSGLTKSVDGQEIPVREEPVGEGYILRFLATFSETSICGDEAYHVYLFERANAARLPALEGSREL